MRRFLAMLAAAVLATVIGSAGFALATHTSQVETHVIPWTIGGQTGAVTIQDTDALPHEAVTVTETVTVTRTNPSSERTWTSSINDGDTVQQGAVWRITTDPDADKVEFWADGNLLGEDSTDPYEHAVDLSAGTHTIGFCRNYGAERLCNGAWAQVTVTAPVATANELPAYRIDVPKENVAYWLSFNSPTTQTIGTDGDTFRQRVVAWSTAGGMSSAFYSARRMYAIFGFRLISGDPGRMANFHNQPNDNPYGWSPLYCAGDSTGSGVSPIAIDYTGDSRGLRLTIEPEGVGRCSSNVNTYVIMPQAEVEAKRGQWVWLWLELDWGRYDQLPDGSARLWVAGEDTPRINVSNINTHYWGQHQISFIQGVYHCSGCSGHTTGHSLEIAATRFGRSPKEAYNDVPVFQSGSGFGQSTGTSPGTHTQVAPRLSTEAAVPASLRW